MSPTIFWEFPIFDPKHCFRFTLNRALTIEYVAFHSATSVPGPADIVGVGLPGIPATSSPSAYFLVSDTRTLKLGTIMLLGGFTGQD